MLRIIVGCLVWLVVVANAAPAAAVSPEKVVLEEEEAEEEAPAKAPTSTKAAKDKKSAAKAKKPVARPKKTPAKSKPTPAKSAAAKRAAARAAAAKAAEEEAAAAEAAAADEAAAAEEEEAAEAAAAERAAAEAAAAEKAAAKEAAEAAAAEEAAAKEAAAKEAAAKAAAAAAIGGLECSPAVEEVEAFRPIPVSCAVTRKGVAQVDIRYRSVGKKKWTRLHLKKTGDEWTGVIPCTATADQGAFRLQFEGLDAAGAMKARIETVFIQLVEKTEDAPPAFPGEDPPGRCYTPDKCPDEFRGTASCPGTKALPTPKVSWGGACERTAMCQSGLACVSGTCETPPKCDTGQECASGECVRGACTFPDPEDIGEGLGQPALNWIGVHFGVDTTLVSEAVDVCGSRSDDSDDYACFRGGSAFDGTLNGGNSGNVSSGFRLATMRAMVSFDRWLFGRLALGARVGFAFGGAPKEFSPVHIEARATYGLRPNILYKRLRPYVGVALGLAQVDTKSKVTVVECLSADFAERTACAEAPQISRTQLDNGTAGVRSLDAYRAGSSLFFGPTLGVMYVFSNHAALSLNVNVMFPDLVLQPSLGFMTGL
ncbi:MAG TPA: hypothetical protein VER33_11190 [Polyangiaceae bacterium]|nr:hypothetical protein [Polyangiaceae bacterium]